MNKKHFKDIPIGGYFGCWGDEYSNYSSPVWMICKKDGPSDAIEIHKDGSEGQRFSISGSDEVVVYSDEEIPKLLDENQQ